MAILKLLRSGHWPSLIGAWLHFEVSFMAWLLIAALGVTIAEEFGLNATRKGIDGGLPTARRGTLSNRRRYCQRSIGGQTDGVVFACRRYCVGNLGVAGRHKLFPGPDHGVIARFCGRELRRGPSHRQPGLSSRTSRAGVGRGCLGNSGTVLAMFFAPRLSEVVGWHGVFGFMIVPLFLTLWFLVCSYDRTVTLRACRTSSKLVARFRRDAAASICLLAVWAVRGHLRRVCRIVQPVADFSA